MQVTTVYFFRFRGVANKWWAFKQMPMSKAELKQVDGQYFGKLMGSGGGEGFSVFPDFSTYVLLQTWENEEAARAFFDGHGYFQEMAAHSNQRCVLFLRAFMSKGSWGGQNPFVGQKGQENPPVLGVLTRARIKPKLMHRFWVEVPQVSREVYQQPARLFSKGIGEWPLVEQATFSLWNSQQLMQDFAYQQKEHKRIVQKTRKLNWYSEELFARFELLKQEGDELFAETAGNS